MSDRGNFRGRGGGGRGSSDRGSGRGGRGGSQAGGEKPKKENILDLTKYMDKQIAVKFSGGREGNLNPRTGGKRHIQLTETSCSDWNLERIRSADESGAG